MLTGRTIWKERPLALSFWAMNIGLGMMVLFSLLPIGLAQGWASVEHGLWYARSADFLQLPLLQTLRWLRLVGDAVFLVGVGLFTWFFLGLWRGWSYETGTASAAEQRGAGSVLPSSATS